MMRILTPLLLCMALSGPALAEVPAPTGATILTLAGAITEGNRGPSTEEDITVLGRMGLSFETGVALDAAMLAALPQIEIATMMPDDETPATFAGPRLSAVMEMAGATGRSAFPTALDGYQVEIPWEMTETYEPILATHLDGVPLGIGDLGPIIVIFPVVDDPDLSEIFVSLQVWATFFIDVE